MTWTLVVPVKNTANGKSRLAPYIGSRRPELAHAMTLDTVQAALSAPTVGGVLAVTNDPALADDLRQMGAQVIGDEPDQGLNPALRHGAARARRDHPDRGIAAMSTDLPALRASELDRALQAAAAHPQSFVPDAPGIGTTLYAVLTGVAFLPRFGQDSRAFHRAAGAVELTLEDIPTVRRDVDEEQDLDDAVGLGIGRRTGELLARVGALV